MIKRIAYTLPILLLALGILFVSVLRTTAIKYEFNGEIDSSIKNSSSENTADIPYSLAYPGKILPDHPLWQLKALRDRVWLLVTTSPTRKAEVKLLFADKRVGMSELLFEQGNSEVGYATLLKAEQYLKLASDQEKENRKQGLDTSNFIRTLAYSSLKHRQVIQSILSMAPEDARPKIIETENYSIDVYKNAMYALHELGLEAPENPFNGG